MARLRINRRGAWIFGAASMLALCLAAVAWAASYSVVFGNTTNGAGSTYLVSPMGYNVYPNVTSKFNQPRAVGSSPCLTPTNPHNGSDLQARVGTPVRAPWDGWIVDIRPAQFELDIYLDLNKDGLRNDNAHLRFDHLSKLPNVPIGLKIYENEILAESGNEGGCIPEHLHFGLRKDLDANGFSDVWIRNEPYYRHSATWDGGRRLDFISLSTYASNIGKITCYAADEVSQVEIVSQGDVSFYHRKVGVASWTETVASKAGVEFQVNFGSLYPAGTQIQWMARCNRTSKVATASPFWAFHPPKFYQPDYSPNVNPGAGWEYFTNTVQ